MINESLVDNYSLQGAYIELTSECNLRCLHCYNESGVLRNLINMKEYENILANDYYKDGYNLFLRMEKYMHNHLLFLHDIRVPATNNEAERLLRNYKRKQAQAVTFRSFESIDYLCQCMSMLVLMRLEDPANIYDRVSRIFG